MPPEEPRVVTDEYAQEPAEPEAVRIHRARRPKSVPMGEDDGVTILPDSQAPGQDVLPDDNVDAILVHIEGDIREGFQCRDQLQSALSRYAPHIHVKQEGDRVRVRVSFEAGTAPAEAVAEAMVSTGLWANTATAQVHVSTYVDTEGVHSSLEMRGETW